MSKNNKSRPEVGYIVSDLENSKDLGQLAKGIVMELVAIHDRLDVICHTQEKIFQVFLNLQQENNTQDDKA